MPDVFCLAVKVTTRAGLNGAACQYPLRQEDSTAWRGLQSPRGCTVSAEQVVVWSGGSVPRERRSAATCASSRLLPKQREDAVFPLPEVANGQVVACNLAAV